MREQERLIAMNGDDEVLVSGQFQRIERVGIIPACGADHNRFIGRDFSNGFNTLSPDRVHHLGRGLVLGFVQQFENDIARVSIMGRDLAPDPAKLIRLRPGIAGECVEVVIVNNHAQSGVARVGQHTVNYGEETLVDFEIRRGASVRVPGNWNANVVKPRRFGARIVVRLIAILVELRTEFQVVAEVYATAIERGSSIRGSVRREFGTDSNDPQRNE